MGMESHALIGGRPRPSRPSRRSSQEISVEPPPTSSTSAASALRSIRLEQPATDSCASSRGLITSSFSPVRSATLARNSGPFSAARQAWVAIARTLTGPRFSILSAQMRKAASARSIAASDSRPD